MKAQRMPPMSVNNKLKLEKIKEEVNLTEFEGALIAKSILFQKIHQLPKSRWSALSDKIINIPINDIDIINTIEKLPRTPREAQLIGVALKRKMEYKNIHKHQLVDPKKIIRMLDLLKKSGNPYYQFHDDYQRFKERCKIEDPDGYTMIFPDTHNEHTDEEILTNQLLFHDDIDNDNSNHSNYASSQNSDTEDIDSDLKSELDFIANDPVRRF